MDDKWWQMNFPPAAAGLIPTAGGLRQSKWHGGGRKELITSRVCGTEELSSINCFHLRTLWGGYSFHFTNENISSRRCSLVQEPKASLSDKGYVFCPLHQAELTSITSSRLRSTASDDTGLGKLSQGSIWNSISLKLLLGSQWPLGVASVMVSEFGV